MEECGLWMDHIPDLALYITLSIGAAIENFIPPVPAAPFIAIGGLLAAALQGRVIAPVGIHQ